MLLKNGGCAKDKRYGVKQGVMRGDRMAIPFEISCLCGFNSLCMHGSVNARKWDQRSRVLYSTVTMIYSDCIELASWGSTDHL
jgi:hypothetical protein